MHTTKNKMNAWRAQRGVTMVSTMLMTFSLLTLGLLAVNNASRQVVQAGQSVARERASLAAQAAVNYASARLLALQSEDLDYVLAGTNSGGGYTDCSHECANCLPTNDGVVVGIRNDALSTSQSDHDSVMCGGTQCMRQGAVAYLNDAAGQAQAMCQVPLNQLVGNADPEATVTIYVRNNQADVLGSSGGGDWGADSDKNVVLTAVARVRSTTIAIQQTVNLENGDAPLVYGSASSDQSYGGGHNNDRSSVNVCKNDYLQVEST